MDLILNDSETTIHFLGRLSQGHIGSHNSCSHEESATGLVSILLIGLDGLGDRLGMAITQRAKVALLDAVATSDATRVVHLVGIEVDARCLAILGAQAARLALVSIKVNLEP